jgi:peptidoglycan hydrolase-like protein with peptidoglycan-binding domain
LAQDLALILVGSDYRRLPDPDGAAEAAALAQALEAEGFEIVSALDRDTGGVVQALETFRSQAEDAERVLIFVAGHILSTSRESWFLTRNAQSETDFTIGAEAVPLGPVLDIAAHSGRAVVLLAPSGDDIGGAGLAPGVVLQSTDDVVLLEGTSKALLGLARGTLLEPGRLLTSLPAGVEVLGDLPDAFAFTPLAAGAGIDREEAFWDVVRTMSNVDAFEAYLDAYPNGRFAALARAAIRELEGRVRNSAEAVEMALGLGREQRRDIQRDLSLLGYNPRGIDGIFGPGSRAAIAAWQRAEGYPPTSYLTAPQIDDMAEHAAIRAAELEREAAARKAEEERQDTIYWRETGRKGDEAGLRAYLARYPDGLYSEIADQRLAEIELSKRAAAAAEERAFWDDVRANDNEAAYRRYLQRYPNGAFAEEAEARLDALTEDAGNAEARAEEQRVAGNAITRLLVENRLRAAGFDPGPIDGVFNNRTRRAIRQFQRAAGLEVSGYVTQHTMVRLLAGR